MFSLNILILIFISKYYHQIYDLNLPDYLVCLQFFHAKKHFACHITGPVTMILNGSVNGSFARSLINNQ